MLLAGREKDKGKLTSSVWAWFERGDDAESLEHLQENRSKVKQTT